MKISNEGLRLIKHFEGCRLEAYRCPAGVLTIGYGHTKGVKEGMKITQEEAEALLKDDLIGYEQAVESNCPHALTQGQFDALVSFTYNCGVGNLKKLLNNGWKDLDQVGEDLLLYINANGRPLGGLKLRREAEQQLFFSDPNAVPCYEEYVGESSSIDIVLTAIGADKDYAPLPPLWTRRIPIAKANGIADYKGTTAQNLKLISLARTGKLRKPT